MRFALFIVVLLFVGCESNRSSVMTGKDHRGSVKIWDIKKGPDGHDYLRFAIGAPGADGAPEDCTILHSQSCKHPDCLGYTDEPIEIVQKDLDNMTKIWEVVSVEGHDYLRFAVGSAAYSNDIRGCSMIHSAGCGHPKCRSQRKLVAQ